MVIIHIACVYNKKLSFLFIPDHTVRQLRKR